MKKIKYFIASIFMASAFFATHAIAEQPQTPNAPKAAAAQQQAVSAAVNINTADAATLAEKLNGVGMKKAQAIVSYREQNGAFKSVDDIVNVSGIGQATLEKNRSLMDIK